MADIDVFFYCLDYDDFVARGNKKPDSVHASYIGITSENFQKTILMKWRIKKKIQKQNQENESWLNQVSQ